MFVKSARRRRREYLCACVVAACGNKMSVDFSGGSGGVGEKRRRGPGSQRLNEEIYLAPPLSLSTSPRPVAVVDTPKARVQDRRIHTCVPLRRPPLPPPSSSHYHNTTKPKSNPTEDGLVNDNEGSFSPPPKESCITNHLDVCWLFFLVFLVFHI